MKIMDVTFRESVLCSEIIKKEQLFEFVEILTKLGVDYIDLCYLKSKEEEKLCDRYDEELIGQVYKITKGKSKLSAMMYPGDFVPSKWNKECLKKIDLIRITTARDYRDYEKLKEIIEYFHGIGVEVSINLLRISEHSDNEYLGAVKQMANLGADYIYLADSNGHLSHDKLKSFIDVLKKNYDGKIGLHGHDNTGQAMLNSITALESGASIIDASLLGYGKGSGNLSLEMFVALLARKHKNEYKVEDVIECYKAAYEFNQEVLDSKKERERLFYSLLGTFDINYTDTKKLLRTEARDKDLFYEVCKYLENKELH